jgi:hypothetical protein
MAIKHMNTVICALPHVVLPAGACDSQTIFGHPVKDLL